MTTEYPSFRNVARVYWRGYISAFIGSSFMLLFTEGTLSAVVVLLLIPDAGWYLVLAIVS